MGKKLASEIILLLLIVILLIVSTSSLVIKIQPIKAEPKTWTVDDDGPADFHTIQEAINAASDGDTIFVHVGTYYARITISRSVSLVGEERNTTVIDGNGVGTVILVIADNASIINFTVKNSGKVWHGSGYPPSCISGDNVNYVNIKSNTLTDAAVCIWFHSSSFVNIADNVIFNTSIAGIIGYSSSYIMMHQNLAYNCVLMGLHLDGSSVNCNITNNVIINTLEGIEIEKSAGNFVIGNKLTDNNVSMVLNQCNGLNIFRENNMTRNWYNLIVWGWDAASFMQDFDVTNIVDGRKIYYFTSSHNLLINPENCPNMGYLAIANCTNITVSNIDLSLNKDGLLMANSYNCSLINVTLSGNAGPLLFGGLTFFRSNNNSVINSKISNSSVGLCLYKSNNNVFFHNVFVDNDVQVISNFYSPFSQPSGPHSVNRWDGGYPLGGNYWSDYNGTDLYCGVYQNVTSSDGIGDMAYTLDADNVDRYPLMAPLTSFDAGIWNGTAYSVGIVSNSTLSDFHIDLSVKAISFSVAGIENQKGFCRITIPNMIVEDLWHGNYTVVLNGEPLPFRNWADTENTYIYISYIHSAYEITIIPEYASATIMLIPPAVITITVTVLIKRKLPKSDKH